MDSGMFKNLKNGVKSPAQPSKRLSSRERMSATEPDVEEEGMKTFSPEKTSEHGHLNDFLMNTAKSPFVNSVRNKSNFFFKNNEELEKMLDPRQADDKTFNRRHKVKNSYMTIFPNYGLYKEDDMYTSAI
jgi:hypothetical protein